MDLVKTLSFMETILSVVITNRQNVRFQRRMCWTRKFTGQIEKLLKRIQKGPMSTASPWGRTTPSIAIPGAKSLVPAFVKLSIEPGGLNRVREIECTRQ